jgi:glycosyltransferase involved in cell wall biosynthesis
MRPPFSRAAMGPGRPLRILLVSQELPCGDIDAASRRFLALVHILAEAGHKMDFQRMFRWESPANSAKYESQLRDLGVRVLPHRVRRGFEYRAVRRALLRNLYDVVFFEYWFAAADGYLEEVRRFQPWARVVIDTVDVHFLRHETGILHGQFAKDNIAESKQRELAVYRGADAVVVVTAEDEAGLAMHQPLPPTYLIPIIIPVRDRPALERCPGLFFVGNYNHAPNLDGILWFSRECWPTIRAAMPEATLTIAGSNMKPEVAALGGIAGVEVVGHVPSTDPYLDRAALIIAPLRFGAGMKGKVTEALACGAPVVTTRFGAQGFGAEPGVHLAVADDPAEFAAQVVSLLRDPARAEAMGRNGRDLLEGLCSPGAVSRNVHRMLAEIAGAGRRPGRPPSRWLAAAALDLSLRAAGTFKAAARSALGRRRGGPPAASPGEAVATAGGTQ